MKLGSPLKSLIEPFNARYWHHAGDKWLNEAMIVGTTCDDDWACWRNPWPWGGTLTTEDFK